MIIASRLFARLYSGMRTDAWFARSCLIAAFAAGVFPDAISHGIILEGRTGHLELLYISAVAIAALSILYIYKWAYSSRYNIAPDGTLELVE